MASERCVLGSGAESQAKIATPGDRSDGYIEVPNERLEDLDGPYCVDPNSGQPGDGIEYWTTQDLDLTGLTWVVFE